MSKHLGNLNWLVVGMALLLVTLSLTVAPVLAVDGPPMDAAPSAPGVISAPPALPDGNQLQTPTLLEDWFGVNLQLITTLTGGYNNYSFDLASFAPTKRGLTANWVQADWYGPWNLSNLNAGPGVRGQVPAGGEWYDVEAIYFDNDMNNIYISIVTSTPFWNTAGGGGVGIYENRIGPLWIRPGDLSLNLGLNAPTNGWSYDFGVDLVHENRSTLGNTVAMRDNNLGNQLYRTANSNWYLSVPNNAAVAGGELTHFDPIFSNLTSLGGVTVTYTELAFADGRLENGAPTYVINVTIPRTLLTPYGLKHGDTVKLRWVAGCRNDGNATQAVVFLTGTIVDIDTGDAPDSTNHAGSAMTYNGLTGNGFFPTVADPAVTGAAGMCHYIKPTGAYLGASVSAEADADLRPDQDTSPDFNLWPASDIADADSDNGLLLPSRWYDGVSNMITYTVSVPAGGAVGDRYVNVWFDWNRDGDWADTAIPVACRTAGLTAAEHAVVNRAVSVAPGQSLQFTSAILPCNPDPFTDKDAVWVRITLSNEPVDLATQFDGKGRAAGPTNEYCYAEGETEDWYHTPLDPSAVALARFEAFPQTAGILIEWETATEISNLGFNLYRSVTADGEYVMVNETLIPVQNPGAVFGAVYTWLDNTAMPGATYFYKLEDVDIEGNATLHGPVAATALSVNPSAISLTAFSAGGGTGAWLPLALSALALLGGLKRRRRQ